MADGDRAALLAELLREYADRDTGYIYGDEVANLREAAALLARLDDTERDYAGYGETLEALTERAEAAEGRVRQLEAALGDTRMFLAKARPLLGIAYADSLAEYADALYVRLGSLALAAVSQEGAG